MFSPAFNKLVLFGASLQYFSWKGAQRLGEHRTKCLVKVKGVYIF